ICPILNALPVGYVAGPALFALLVQWRLRKALLRQLCARSTMCSLKLGFRVDLAVFLISGVALSIFNHLWFNVPLENALKVFTAFLALGFYITVDLALRRERETALTAQRNGGGIALTDEFTPVTRKFLTFSIVNLVILTTVVMLVTYKDLVFLGTKRGAAEDFFSAVFMELAFAVTVLSVYVGRVIHQYSRTMDVGIKAKHEALRKVQRGELDTRVPILSNDELGRTARLTNTMIERLQASLRETEKAQNATLVSLIALATRRDNETGQHLQRTQAYVGVLARAMDEVSEHEAALMEQAAPLHDIGKVGIPDAILLKPGKLDDDEFAIMKTHSEIGAQALAEAEERAGGSALLSVAREIAQTHHEKWDGSGYPVGLSGEDIPLSGRIMALADVYDALRAKRPYKEPMDHTKACEIIVQGNGRHFDPAVVKVFLENSTQLAEIAERFADKEELTPVRKARVATAA
ncbi:MAG: HD domain-containing phosphohydrolase, partial [Pseudomonadota bacterium]